MTVESEDPEGTDPSTAAAAPADPAAVVEEPGETVVEPGATVSAAASAETDTPVTAVAQTTDDKPAETDTPVTAVAQTTDDETAETDTPVTAVAQTTDDKPASGSREHGGGAAPTAEAGTPVVTTSGLVRSFGQRRAVDGIDLVVPQDSIFGFLGPNGSGKTTTIRLLLGLIRADSGSVELFGQPMPKAAARVLPRVGALVEGPAFYPYLTGRANLARLQALDKTDDPRSARRRRDEALDRVGLTAAAGKRYRHYSLGMKQRLGIAATLLRPRDLLILDEPTNGLDPQGTREIRQLIRQLHAEGTTIIVSSHLLSEVEQVCTHVGIMSSGRLIAQQPLVDLRAARTLRLRVETTAATVGAARTTLAGLGLSCDATPGDGGVTAGAGGVTPGQGGVTAGAGGVAAGAGGVTPGQGGVTAGAGGVAAGAGGVTAGAGGVTAGAGGVTPGQGGVAAGEGETTLLVPVGDRPTPEVARALVEAGVDIVGLTQERPGLEEIFVELTGAGFDVAG